METHLNCIAVSSVSPDLVSVEQMRRTYNQLLDTASHGFYQTKSHIYTDLIENYSKTVNDYIDNSSLQQICKYLTTGLFDRAEEEIISLIMRFYVAQDVPPVKVVSLFRSVLDIMHFSMWNELPLREGETENLSMLTMLSSADFNQVTHLEQLCNIFLGFFDLCRGYSAESKRPPYYSSLLRARQYVKEHFQEKINLDEISAYSQLSKNYFCTVFKQEFNETFSSFLTSVRMDHAKKLLKTTNLSISEITFRCGYDSNNYFSTSFQKYVGMSPQQFRRTSGKAEAENEKKEQRDKKA